MLTYGYRWKSDPLNWNLFNCCDHWIALPGFETVVNDIDGTTVNQSRKIEIYFICQNIPQVKCSEKSHL